MKHVNRVKHPTHFNDISINTNVYIDIIIYKRIKEFLPKYLTSITRNTDEISSF